MKLCLVETYGTCEITCFWLFPNQNVHILSPEKAFISFILICLGAYFAGYYLLVHIRIQDTVLDA